MRYASKTKVSVDKSEQEIRKLLQRYAAVRFASGWDIGSAFVTFVLHDREVRFIIQLPTKEERRFTHGARGRRTPDAIHREWEQACRQSWRALLLVLKAKLEAVESKIATFENEFLAHLVMPDGRTIGEYVVPRLAAVMDGQQRLLVGREGAAKGTGVFEEPVVQLVGETHES